MKNKWLIMFIFIIAVTLFLSVDFSKIQVNGNTAENYQVYYEAFEDKALDETTGAIKSVTRTLNSITNIFNNIRLFFNDLFSNNDLIITNLATNQGNAVINDFKIINKKQNFLIEYFTFYLSGSGFNQIVFIGKNFLIGASSGSSVNEARKETYYKDFDYVSNSMYSDFGVTIYNLNYNFCSVLKKEDLFALNDIDLIIIPFCVQYDNFDIYNSLTKYLNSSNLDNIIISLNEINVNYWKIQDVDENTTGTVGNWVKNYS